MVGTFVSVSISISRVDFCSSVSTSGTSLSVGTSGTSQRGGSEIPYKKVRSPHRIEEGLLFRTFFGI